MGSTGIHLIMTCDEARAIFLSFEGSSEGFHHGHPDFRVDKNIFATLWPDENRSVLMLGPEMTADLAARNPAAFKAVWAGKCLSMQLEAIEADEFRDLAEIAWQRHRKT
jgi:hypothetical protein